MKIVCPSCTATYDVPDGVVAAKRAVRCARCGNNWVPAGDDAAPHAEAPDATRPETVSPETIKSETARPENVRPENLRPENPGAEMLAPQGARPPPDMAAPPAAFGQALPPAADITDSAAAFAGEPEIAPPAPAPLPSSKAPPPAEQPLPPSRGAGMAAAPAPPKSTPVTKDVAPVQTAPVAGWIASIALLLIMALSGVVFRAAIMKSWPPSERLYAAIGLDRR